MQEQPLTKRAMTLLQKSPLYGSMFWSPQSALDNTNYTWFALIFVVLFIVFYILGKFKKTKTDPLLVTLDNNDFIDVILQRCAESGTRFDVLCSRQGLLQKHVQGYCRLTLSTAPNDNATPEQKEKFAKSRPEIKGEKDNKDAVPILTLELQQGSMPVGWDNAPVDIYFQLTIKGVTSYYHFASFVHRVGIDGSNMYLEIIRPSILSDTQTQDALRVEPTPEMVAMASVWLFPSSPLFMPTEISTLKQAHAMFKPEGDSDFHIVYISANGIRLRFVRDHMETLPCHFEKNGQACLLLVLNSQDQVLGRIPLWLKATCLGFSPSDDKECIDARFSFTHWEQISKRSSQIHWFPATDKDTVPPLMHWIMHEVLHLQHDSEEQTATADKKIFVE